MASAMLKVAWNFDLLSVIYLCIDSEDRMVLYTFNHFASMYPKPWREAQQKLISSPWTLFKLFTEHENVCRKNLFFNKVKLLHGYNLKAIVHDYPPLYRYDKANVGYERFDGVEFRIMSTALKRVNATLIVKDSAADGYMDTDGYKT
ncbi:hypothetical protein TSAR_005702 [Trichomalopsis sarcophagae]|uniref:Uncharacterized protein n=1 Tax=Trichomalopsis sarcophagae TaxID=543379 RepID=A0A232EGT7_9HYME|nr:hypothetical protein TSAR_005702 [Trichomalopsis sarcophagae]